jgi:hypothetical protein
VEKQDAHAGKVSGVCCWGSVQECWYCYHGGP